jgi:ribonuclease Z
MARLIEKSLGGHRILGFSLAGEETVIAAPELNVCFDIGRAPRDVISIDNVLLSHGHMDHAAGIAYYFSQRGFIGNAPGRLLVHPSLFDPVRRLMQVWAEIEGHPAEGEVIAAEPLRDFELRKGLIARPFAVNHRAAALGYSLIERRHKLKAEFVGLTGPQIVELKKKGITIDDRVEVTLLTYPGDTALGRFLELDFVQQSKALLLECTFFEPEHRTRAVAGKHIHVDDLPRILEAIPDAEVMLVHMTRRTDLRFAKTTLKRVVAPRDYERISFLMERPPRETSKRQNVNTPTPEVPRPQQPAPAKLRTTFED